MSPVMKTMKVTRAKPSRVTPVEETPKGMYYLSNLDHYTPMIVKTMYCFEHRGAAGNKGERRPGEVMRTALEKVLVHYYPLAGRLEVDSGGKFVVNCTGEGAVFVEAEADCVMEEIVDVVTNPDPHTLDQLVYYVGGKSLLDKPLMAVQVTEFKCGGWVLGVCLSHCVTDGRGAMEFVNSWGETARGLPLSLPPVHDRTFLNPRTPPRIDHPHGEFAELEDISGIENLFNTEPLVFKTFRFEPEKLERVKALAKQNGTVGNCSTFQALTAFAFRARTKALRMAPEQDVKLIFAVDGRGRFEPPLPKGYFGNAVVMAHVLCKRGDLDDKPLSDTVERVQEAIRAIDDGYMRSGIDHFEVNRRNPALAPSTLMMVTWTRLAFQAVDFGWGTPVSSGLSAMLDKEVILFLSDAKDVQTIKLLLCLPESAMNTFDQLMDI